MNRHVIASVTRKNDRENDVCDGMPDEPPGSERANGELGSMHHFWRRTRNIHGSNKKAVDVERRRAGVENATIARTATGHRAGQQHPDGVRGNEEWGLGGKRTPCQPKYRDHYEHGAVTGCEISKADHDNEKTPT